MLAVSPGPRAPNPTNPAAAPFAPKVHLYLHTERMLVDRGAFGQTRFEEEITPVIELRFEYAGVQVRASDPRERLFLSTPGGLSSVERNLPAERQARWLLEGFGAVELGCMPSHEPPFDSRADYLVHAETSVEAYCAFTSHALVELKKQGFSIEIQSDYPYQIIEADPAWYGALHPVSAGSCHDWFNLELGIEIDGMRVDLLKALLDILESAPKSASLGQVLEATKRIALPVGDNRYLCVPRQQMALILGVLRDLYTGALRPDEPKAIPPLRREQCATVARLRRAFKQRKTALHFEHPWLEQGEQILEPAALQVRPSPVNAELRPYQTQGVAWLQALSANNLNGILADDMGLGKTLQTIAHIAGEKQAGHLQLPVLIVAPTSLVGNWQNELSRFAPGLKVRTVHGAKRRQSLHKMHEVDVVLTTYPVLVRDLSVLGRQRFHMVVLDEAQAIKNAKSQTHRAARSLQAAHRLCLTGTPIENNLSEIWALFDFLMPNFLGSKEFFAAQFRTPIEREGNVARFTALRARVAPFILRRMKARVAAELPAKTLLTVAIELGDAQRDLYESIRVAAHAEVRAAIRKKGLQGSTVTILDALMKLRQVCCDPRLLRVKAAAEVTHSAKYERLLELLERQLGEGHRILVFSQFTSMLSLIERGVRALGIDPLVLTGATERRQDLIDRFAAGSADLFLISLKAGGTGLNLIGADTVIHYDPWWNPAAQAQATDRAHRIGQTKPVFVHNLIVSGSVEERMVQLQRHKAELASGLLHDDTAVNLQWSEEQVHHLFAPLPQG